MLVLRRNVGEEVVLCHPDGSVIGRIHVVDVKGGKVRLGFTFPDEIEVHRREVYQEKFLNLTEQDHAKREAT